MPKRYLSNIFAGIVCILILASCNTSRRATVPSRDEGYIEEIEFSRLPKERKLLVREAEEWLGTPYVYARQDKGKGTDCSGLVMQVYLTALDCELPRNSARQAEFCRRIKAEEAVAGDLVFFATGKDKSKVSHVGILVDEESFIHASSSKGVVRSKMSNPWYAKRFLMYGRVPGLDKKGKKHHRR